VFRRDPPMRLASGNTITYAGTTASSQENHVFSQLIARSSEDIRANILSFLSDQTKNVLSLQYRLAKTLRTFIVMSIGLCPLGDYRAIEENHWRAEADHDRASAVHCSECDLCGVRSHVLSVSYVLFVAVEMYSRPTRLPNTRRVKRKIGACVGSKQVRLCELCESCSGCVNIVEISRCKNPDRRASSQLDFWDFFL